MSPPGSASSDVPYEDRPLFPITKASDATRDSRSISAGHSRVSAGGQASEAAHSGKNIGYSSATHDETADIPITHNASVVIRWSLRSW